MSGANGHDGGDNDKVTPFPDPNERRILKLRAANDVREPVLNLPPAVKWLSLALLVITAAGVLLPQEMFYAILFFGGFVPARYTGGLPFGAEAVYSPVTHLFLHGGALHAGVNIITLMAFGTGLEREMGARRMLLLYFASGLLAAAMHFAIFPHLQGPLIGASGAISGLFGGILMMMYDSGVMGKGLWRMGVFIGIWLLITAFFGYFGVPGTDMAVGWTAHIGGFLAGLALYRPLMRLKA